MWRTSLGQKQERISVCVLQFTLRNQANSIPNYVFEESRFESLPESQTAEVQAGAVRDPAPDATSGPHEEFHRTRAHGVANTHIVSSAAPRIPGDTLHLVRLHSPIDRSFHVDV